MLQVESTAHSVQKRIADIVVYWLITVDNDHIVIVINSKIRGRAFLLLLLPRFP
jgi:hypothetical protein